MTRRRFAVIGGPGAGFAFSNIDYNLIEILIEDVTAQPSGDLMVQAELQPVDVGEASFDWTPALASSPSAGALITLVLWAAAQEYLILYSVLPGLNLWLGFGAAALGVVMVLSAFWAPKPRS